MTKNEAIAIQGALSPFNEQLKQMGSYTAPISIPCKCGENECQCWMVFFYHKIYPNSEVSDAEFTAYTILDGYKAGEFVLAMYKVEIKEKLDNALLAFA